MIPASLSVHFIDPVYWEMSDRLHGIYRTPQVTPCRHNTRPRHIKELPSAIKRHLKVQRHKVYGYRQFMTVKHKPVTMIWIKE